MPVPPRVTVYQSAAIDGTGCAVITVSFAARDASFPLGNALRDFLQMIPRGTLVAFSSALSTRQRRVNSVLPISTPFQFRNCRPTRSGHRPDGNKVRRMSLALTVLLASLAAGNDSDG